jgi:hypothetical protein
MGAGGIGGGFDDMADIFDFMDCEGCPCHKVSMGKTWGDPDTCCPGEVECFDGDFGNGYPCSRMLSRIEEGLRDGDFAFARSYLVNAWCLTDPEIKENYRDVLAAWPDVAWDKHPYWRIFYDETSPMGFNTAAEVYKEVFQ